MAPYYSKGYLSVQVETSDRVELVISLYEAALTHIAQAMEAVEAGDAAKRGDRITKAANVLMTLCESLDYSQPGPLAANLFGIYNLHLRQLLEANRTSNLVALQSVRSSLSVLLSGWRQVMRSPEAEEIRKTDINRLNGRQATPEAAYAGRPSLVMTA